jgi:hypothetical protein
VIHLNYLKVLAIIAPRAKNLTTLSGQCGSPCHEICTGGPWPVRAPSEQRAERDQESVGYSVAAWRNVCVAATRCLRLVFALRISRSSK